MPARPGNLALYPVLSRTSAVIFEDAVIIGTMQASFGGCAWWLALDRQTGALKWGTQADAHVAAVVTLSPTVHGGVVYTGVSSLEENVASREWLALPRGCYAGARACLG